MPFLWNSPDPSRATVLDTTRLQNQYDDLRAQFGGSSSSSPSYQTRPNNRSFTGDFSYAESAPSRNGSSSSFLKRFNGTGNPAKSVRFSDAMSTDDQANRNSLLPYKDEPDGALDHALLDNQQIHVYHSQVLQDQDAQLDRLGESIGRQRELTIQIGDELDDQAGILDDVDRHVDRHQTQLDRAKNRIGKIARKAKDNTSLTIILILIIILVLLIMVLK